MFVSNISRQNTIYLLSPSVSRAIFLTLQTRRRFSSSGLHDRYNFIPPPSLSPPEPNPRNSNPKPSIRKPSEADLKRERKKNHLHPPSLTLDRLGTFRPWRSNLLFDFRHSYTEISRKDRPIGLREPKYSPFGPGRLDREWTGVCALAVDPKVKSVEGDEESADSEAVMAEKRKRMREKIQGKDLTRDERSSLVETYRKGKTKRQINLGRDGLTHNMLSEIHNHWKSAEAVRIKCQGVPTVDMDNICYQLEDKTCGKIIFRHSCILMLYRGRHYTAYRRPSIPLMLWKPHAPIFPKLIKPIIGGLTKEETTAMRKRGLAGPALTKLAKNGYYGNLVLMVRDAFLFCDLVRIDCEGLEKSDYRKIGAKLRDLVPCIPVTFHKEQIVIWRGNDYTPPESEIFLDQLKSRDEIDSESSTHDEREVEDSE